MLLLSYCVSGKCADEHLSQVALHTAVGYSSSVQDEDMSVCAVDPVIFLNDSHYCSHTVCVSVVLGCIKTHEENMNAMKIFSLLI